jgi:hypothetical protein
MGIKRAWRKIKSAAKGLFRPSVGFPLGDHVPADPADHAEDFAHRYAEPLDWLAAIRMEELGIPSERIGSSDHRHGLAGRAFNPYERDGGGISPGGRINLDSGSFNPNQITKQYGKRAGKLWAKSRLRDRWDALVAHEDAEWRMGGDHDAAVRVAPETELPISDRARQILVEMRRGWRGR